jgi:protein subunit release factor B
MIYMCYSLTYAAGSFDSCTNMFLFVLIDAMNDEKNNGNVKFSTDIKELKKISRIDYFSGRGRGGQHRNRHYNCVRIHHPLSNITVVATEHRSQHKNRKLAFQRLVEKLEDLNRERPLRIPTSAPVSVRERKREDKIRRSFKKLFRKKIRLNRHGSTDSAE